MIKHHPSQSLLEQFVEGSLPASLSVAISAHVEMCPCCKQKCDNLEVEFANNNFSEVFEDEDHNDFTAMFDNIVEDESFDVVKEFVIPDFEYQGKNIKLPRAIANLDRTNFTQVGRVARSRFLLEDDELRTSLLHIEPGGEIPNHTHTGFELTLLLDGEFEDESGHYQAGDFIWLDGRHSHTPKTKEGCLCFTLANSPLHFNKGISKLLNPIGKLIY